MKLLDEIEKRKRELKDKLFYAALIDYDEYAAMNNYPTPDEVADEAINNFITHLIEQIEKEVVPEERRKDFGHIGNDTSKAYDLGIQNGFNSCREQLISNFKKLINPL